MKNGREKRRAFRILERVHLKYEVLTEQEYENRLEEHRMSKGVAEGSRSRLMDLDARLTEKLYVLKSQSSAVAECLALLNQKVNMLIEQSPALRESKTSLVREEAQSCEVSAVGMTFASREVLAPGTKLALRLMSSPTIATSRPWRESCASWTSTGRPVPTNRSWSRSTSSA